MHHDPKRAKAAGPDALANHLEELEEAVRRVANYAYLAEHDPDALEDKRDFAEDYARDAARDRR